MNVSNSNGKCAFDQELILWKETSPSTTFFRNVRKIYARICGRDICILFTNQLKP